MSEVITKIYEDIGDGLFFDYRATMYEDELPELTDDQYKYWYRRSFLSDGSVGVRMGFAIVKLAIVRNEYK